VKKKQTCKKRTKLRGKGDRFDDLEYPYNEKRKKKRKRNPPGLKGGKKRSQRKNCKVGKVVFVQLWSSNNGKGGLSRIKQAARNRMGGPLQKMNWTC